MTKVCILQTDNRPSLSYLVKTAECNKMFCNKLGYHYLFLILDNNKYGNIHPATKKIYIVNELLLNSDYDIIVFLDSDAWIQNGNWLKQTIDNLIENQNIHGCFSRDPYVKKNTFINSGSFIIKNNEYTKNMYKTITGNLQTDHSHHNSWPYDQYYMSNNVFENKDSFTVFVPDILNTPIGKVLRHNWCKNKKMYDDLNHLLSTNGENTDKIVFDIKNYIDNKPFPNTIPNGYEYFS